MKIRIVSEHHDCDRNLRIRVSGLYHYKRNRLPPKGFGGVRKESNMLWTIFVILLILWLLGFMGGYTLGGLIHILLVIAIVVVLIQVFQGRRRV